MLPYKITKIIFVQVGVAADLKNNYLARLSDVFHLHHVKVVCESSEDNVAAESISDPLWLRGGKARIKLTTPAPPHTACNAF